METKQTIKKVFLMIFATLMMPCLGTAGGMSTDPGDNSKPSGQEASAGDISKEPADDAHSGMYQKHIRNRLDAGIDQTVNNNSIAMGYVYTEKRQGASKSVRTRLDFGSNTRIDPCFRPARVNIIES